MDRYKEQYLKAEKGKEYKAFKTVNILCIVGLLFSILSKNILILVAYIVIIGFSYALMKRSIVEYEYEIFDGTFSVSEIFNKSKRKEVFKIDIKDITEVREGEKTDFNDLKEHQLSKYYPTQNICNTVFFLNNGGKKRAVALSLNNEMLDLIKISRRANNGMII